MSDERAVTFTEERIPLEDIEETIAELIDLYGGELTDQGAGRRTFTLPLRRGNASSGQVECTVWWAAADAAEATVTLTCDRSIDAPKMQRVLMLAAGVVGALLFTIWPFFPHRKEFGALAWIGGAIAIAVYFMTLRKTSGGLAFDFLQRLARRQRALVEAPEA